MPRKPLTVIDLFAGVGGFALGFLKANEQPESPTFDIRLLVDIDPSAAFTFKKNYPIIPFWPNPLPSNPAAPAPRQRSCELATRPFPGVVSLAWLRLDLPLTLQAATSRKSVSEIRWQRQ